MPGGALVAVIGPNGAGKSTLLRTPAESCNGQRPRPLAGRPLSAWSGQKAQRRAVLSQQCTLAFPLRRLGCRLARRTRTALGADGSRQLSDQLIARAALDLVGLGPRMQDSYDTLSGGQQLCHLARVLAQIWRAAGRRGALPPLDEPTASLDLRYQHLVLSRAQRLSREGAAVLAVLHDVNLAAQYADVLVVLQDGRVAAQGSPRKVHRSRRFCPRSSASQFLCWALRAAGGGSGPALSSCATSTKRLGEVCDAPVSTRNS